MSRWLIALILIFPLSVSAQARGIDRYHGNYCGTDSGDPSFSTVPVDALDRACMIHDQCYTATRGSCACDITLRDAAYAIKKNAGFSDSLRDKAGRIAFAMAVKPCGS